MKDEYRDDTGRGAAAGEAHALPADHRLVKEQRVDDRVVPAERVRIQRQVPVGHVGHVLLGCEASLALDRGAHVRGPLVHVHGPDLQGSGPTTGVVADPAFSDRHVFSNIRPKTGSNTCSNQQSREPVNGCDSKRGPPLGPWGFYRGGQTSNTNQPKLIAKCRF